MIEKLTTACSKVFPLTTLRDIFNLPTFDQMVVCLEELTACMIQARATNDLMVALVAEKGIAVEKAFEWPEVLEWKDDGKWEVGTAYAGPDGKVLFSMKVSRDSSNGQGYEAGSETNALRERYKKDKILSEDEWKDRFFEAMAKMERERNEARREAMLAKGLRDEEGRTRADPEGLNALAVWENAVRNLRDVQGRYHTQIAMERLFALLPENAIGEARADSASPPHQKGN